MLPTPHRPPSQISRDIAQLRAKLQFQELPSLPVLEATVQRLGARAVIDESLKPDLQLAVMAERDAQALWATRAQDNTTLKLLENELNESAAASRMELATAATERVSRAMQEFHHASLVCGRAYRSLLTASAQASNVPGAQYQVPAHYAKLHLPTLYSVSWSGTLGEAMSQGLQQFEQPIEREAA